MVCLDVRSKEQNMKYVRFQGLKPCLGTPSKIGIFQLAYELKYSSVTSEYDDRQIRRDLNWLEMHLDAPSVLDKEQHFRAICWFKDAAREPLKRIWSMKRILEEYGYWIDVVKSERPGNIIYEDGWQVVAKPRRRRR